MVTSIYFYYFSVLTSVTNVALLHGLYTLLIAFCKGIRVIDDGEGADFPPEMKLKCHQFLLMSKIALMLVNCQCRIAVVITMIMKMTMNAGNENGSIATESATNTLCF
jgi:hypothetical protein